MSGTPYMPLWVGDFLLKAGDLDARETGAYLLLLMAMWSRDGSLPADQKKLQRVAKCGREWPAVWAAIGHYFTEENGRITNKRLTEELQKVCAKREVNRHNGELGGRAKALKDKELHMANATVSPQQSYSESEREEKREAKASPEKKLRRRLELPLPDGWVPSDRNIADAEARNFTSREIDENAERFRNHHHAKGTRYRDWDAAWRTWLGNARRFSAPRHAGPSGGHSALLAGFHRAATGIN